MGFIDSMSDDQRKRWYRARALNTNSDRQAYRYSWLDQASGSLTNTHWAFGTMGLPPWAVGDSKMVAEIYQVRSNAAREIMDIVRDHTRADSNRQYQESCKIMEELEAEFDDEQIRASKSAMNIHSERNLNHLSESLTKRREWLIDNQPTEIEALTMRPERRRTDKIDTPKELVSEDDDYLDLESPEPSGTDTKDHENPRKRKRVLPGHGDDRKSVTSVDDYNEETTWSTATSRRCRRRRRPSNRSEPRKAPTSEKPDQTGYRHYRELEGQNRGGRGIPGNRVRGRRPFRRGQRGSHSTLSRESTYGQHHDQGPSRVRGRPGTHRRQTHRE